MSIRAEINTRFDGYVNVCLIGEGVDKLSEGVIAESIELSREANSLPLERAWMVRGIDYVRCYPHKEDAILKAAGSGNKIIPLVELRPNTDNQRDDYQSRVAEWLEECFGESDDPLRKSRRVHRFVEEAVELAQSLDCSKADVLELVDYVFGRAIGEPKQEVGGVLVTLMGVCESHGLNATQCGEDELSRVWTKVDAIRAKNARQVRGSALPGATIDEKGIDVT